MRAVVVHGANDIRIEERMPVPPRAGEIQLQIEFAGICGSDLHYFREGRVGAFEVREPLVVGHEVVGRVAADPRAELDPGSALQPGTPVAVHPATPGTPVAHLKDRMSIWPGGRYLGSAATFPHTQGAMSDLVTVRTDQVRVLPQDLPLSRAVLSEPLAVGLHAIRRAGGVAGKRVLVSGAGPIGLLAATACVIQGAEQVTVSDMLSEPLELAHELGVDRTIRIGSQDVPSQAFDVVLECAGAPAALGQAVQAVSRGGVVVQVGSLPAGAHPVDLSAIVSREIDIRGAFRFDDELDEAIVMLAERAAFAAIVTDVFDVTDALAAFERAGDPRASSKVVLRFT